MVRGYHLVSPLVLGGDVACWGMPKATTVQTRYLSLPERRNYRRLEDVVGCKWSAAVVAAIGRGITRPGQLERFIPGISTKVLNERLRKLLDYGLITRHEHPGKVMKVEYKLTPMGRRVVEIIEQLRELDQEHEASRSGSGIG